MRRTTAYSILKVKEDVGEMTPVYPEEDGIGSEVQSTSGEFQRSIFNANWDSATQLEPPFTVDSAKSTDKPESGLSYMQAAFFATVLEDFLMSIRVVGECQSKIRQMKASVDMDQLVANKYGVGDCPFPPDELAGITNENIGCENFKLNKLISDRLFMEEVMTDTYTELSVDSSYFQLLKANTDYEIQRQRFPSITEEEAKNKSLHKKLRRQLRVQQNVNAAQMDGCCANIERLQEQFEETKLVGNIQDRFLNRWQSSRIQQQEVFIRREEKSIAGNIVKYKMKLEEEARVHGEMDLLVGILINEMLAEIENLMLKYEHDTEALDLKIQKRRHAYEEMVKKREELEQQVAHKRQQIQHWGAFKEERIRRIQYQKKMQNAALIIQAWWRGLLARHELGPYRHHKKGKRSKKRKSTTSDATY